MADMNLAMGLVSYTNVIPNRCFARKDGGILVAEPPSWAWVWRRSTMRHGVYGDRSSFQVRLSLAIAKNLVTHLRNVKIILFIFIISIG